MNTERSPLLASSEQPDNPMRRFGAMYAIANSAFFGIKQGAKIAEKIQDTPPAPQTQSAQDFPPRD